MASRLAALDPGDALRRAVGIPRTIGGVVYSAATVTEPGHVEVEAADDRVILGEVDGRHHAAAAGDGRRHRGRRHGRRRRCRISATRSGPKLLGNMMTGPLCLLARSSMQDTLAGPVVREAAIAAWRGR